MKKNKNPVSMESHGLQIYMILDKLANRFGSPVFAALPPDQYAESYRSSIINNLQESIRLQDCDAYHYGTFDPVTGTIHAFDRPVLLFRCSDYIKEAIQANKNNPRICITYKEYDLDGNEIKS